MIGWIAVVAAIIYIGVLFVIAHYGDRAAAKSPIVPRPTLYALALSIYCTSWTFFGSVGLASVSGLDFLTIYIGPILMFTLGYPLVRRVVRLAKMERITSVADFLGARYGKNRWVAVVATVIVVTGTIPYIALQLKAIASSMALLVPNLSEQVSDGIPIIGDTALLVTLALALFGILFGTRHTDAREHQEGLMLAVGVEAVVKLAAFLIAGVYITYVLFDGLDDILTQAAAHPQLTDLLQRRTSIDTLLAMSLLAFAASILLPRQFHIGVVENNSEKELKRAAWLFPLYLIAINLFVIPIAMAGVLTFGPEANGDLFVLNLPLAADNGLITLIVFLGGLSAATAMVIVASVALAIMISNEIIVPLILRSEGASQPADMGRLLRIVRRIIIVAVLMLAYTYYRSAGSPALATIGLLSFAAIGQIAPAFFVGLAWKRATAAGAIAGMIAGFAVWAYTLLLPTLAGAGMVSQDFIQFGPAGYAFLRPESLFNSGMEPFAHGVFWSLAVNIFVLVSTSLTRSPHLIERLQANVFVPSELTGGPTLGSSTSTVTIGELSASVERYLGKERTARSFQRWAHATGNDIEPEAYADLRLLRFAEQLLASAIGAASSRLVLSLLINRGTSPAVGSHSLLDEASEALFYNRDLLQTLLDGMDQGVAVFDADLNLICWNRPFRKLLNLAPVHGQIGAPFRDMLRDLSRSGLFGEGDPDVLAASHLQAFVMRHKSFQSRHPQNQKIVLFSPRPMGKTGTVVMVTDMTSQIESAAELEEARITLEKRVEERTQQLSQLNEELEKANAAAEEANVGKTRFIAAAGHDILQPLNAARLYATALAERTEGSDHAPLAQNLETALDGVEDIFKTVLELSRLDTGQMKPDLGPVALNQIFDRIKVEFQPRAEEKGLDLTIIPCSVAVRSDQQLLTRLLQNLVSNAIKYTKDGRVIVGCRRKRGRLSIEVIDTGIGIPLAEQEAIFQEFKRLDAGAKESPGLGLGLSIVERLSAALNHPLNLSSGLGRGTRIAIEAPVAIAVPDLTGSQVSEAPGANVGWGLFVLCIDDDPKILSGMEALLSGWGAHTITAEHAREAVRLLKTADAMPDLMLVDYHLGSGNGLTAIAEIRWKFGADIPAILITADRSPQVRDAAIAAGVRVLNKPLKPAALRALMSHSAVQRTAAE